MKTLLHVRPSIKDDRERTRPFATAAAHQLSWRN